MDDGVTALSSAAHHTEPFPDFRARAWPRFGLRTKGMVSLLAMFVYVALFAVYITRDRQQLLDVVKEYGQVQGHEHVLSNMKSALILSTVELKDATAPRNAGPTRQGMSVHIAAIANELVDLAKRFPELEPGAAQFRTLAAAYRENEAQEVGAALRRSALGLVSGCDHALSAIEANRQALERRVEKANRDLFVVWTAGAAAGVVGFGILVALFFRRLANDIGSLERRAVAVVRGYRDAPLVVSRHDEVGRLALAVNGMQRELRRWEQQQEVQRQKRFHQEKMAAVGSLAAAVAHEVMNPIAAIAGIAQEIADSSDIAEAETQHKVRIHARVIIDQTARIGAIMRQVSDLTARHSSRPEPLDVNGLIAGTCGFIKYDRRFRNIRLVSSLDSTLPAAYAVADHVTQVLMNLLINAADSMDGLAGREPEISVATHLQGGEVMVEVRDNGSGMSPAVLERAFDEFFSTKPAEKGSGIGLFMCKTLIEQNGGWIRLESQPGTGTTARFVLPALARLVSVA